MKTTDSASEKVRRYQSALMVCGSAVIALSLWEAVKIFVYLSLNANRFLAEIFKNNPRMDSRLTHGVYYFFVLVTILIISSFRIYVGFSAGAEGRGRKKGPLYLVIAMIMVILLVLSIWNYSRAFFLEPPANNKDTTVATFLIDCFSLMAMVEMIFSAFKVRSLQKKRAGDLQEGEEEIMVCCDLPAAWTGLEQENQTPDLPE